MLLLLRCPCQINSQILWDRNQMMLCLS